MKKEKDVRETAYGYLAARMRTVEEVRRHLTGKGFGAEETEETISELKELGYLDDLQYALRYFEYNRDKKRGSLRAARELADRGVDAGIIRNAREDFMYENHVDEFGDALALAEAMEDKREAAVARRLDSRGFSRDTIFRVLDRLRRDEAHD